MALEQVDNVVEYLCQECGSQGMIWADPWMTHEEEGNAPATYAVTCPVCGRTAWAVRRPVNARHLKPAAG